LTFAIGQTRRRQIFDVLHELFLDGDPRVF
ncbi:MAG: hypothetical protein K0S56_4580, partial [Microvirga sp.]|nr:hypothetical protein [Microvirga sp.]